MIFFVIIVKKKMHCKKILYKIAVTEPEYCLICLTKISAYIKIN